MPSAKTTLTNCYTPTALKTQTYKISPSSRPCGGGRSASKTTTTTTTTDTRSSNAIRRLCLDRSILASSTGSSIVELGHTKVLCSVHGPRPATSSSLSSGSGEFQSSGVLNCEIRYAPTFGFKPETRVMTSATNLDGYAGSSSSSGVGGGGGFASNDVELSLRLHDAISSSVPLDLLMKSVVDVFVMVLQDDGSVFAASVMAASMALCDAGVEVYDMVSACSVAIIHKSIPSVRIDDEDDHGPNCKDSEYILLADPDEEETLVADGVLTLALMSNWNEVTFWDQTGRLPPNVAAEAAELCRDGCNMMSKFVKETLIGNS